MARSINKTVRIGPLGSFFVGLLLFAVGYWLKRFVAGLDDTSSQAAIYGSRAGLGLMIFGGIVAIGNLLWFLFIIFVAAKKPPKL